jgi:polyhydroxyalkanoate synthesis regulator phasin
MVQREEIRAMQDAWRAYLDLALGLTETSRKRATKVAKKLVGKGGATAEQLQTVAEDLVSTSMANREALTRLVRYELERALGRVGLATADEVTALTTRVHDLERQLADAKADASPVALRAVGVAEVPASLADPGPEPVSAAPAKKAVAKRPVAAKKVAKKVVVPAPAAVTPAATTPPAARKTVAKRTAAKKAAPVQAAEAPVVAKKTVAKRTAAKKAPAQDQP